MHCCSEDVCPDFVAYSRHWALSIKAEQAPAAIFSGSEQHACPACGLL